MQGKTLIQPLKIELFEKQRWAFYSPATEMLYGGAAAGGKSFLLRCSGIRWAEQIPGIQVYLFRRTFPDLKKNHLRGPKNFFELLGPQLRYGSVKYNKQDNDFCWQETNSRITLCHCQHEDDVRNYQGAEIHVLLMDELTLFTEYQYRFLRGRTRMIGMNVPEIYRKLLPRVECGSNPGGIGHKFVKSFWIVDEEGKEVEPLKIWQAPAAEGGMLRQYIPALLEDNPQALIDDPDYETKLLGLGSEALVKAMRYADWSAFAGQFFSEWRPDHHIYTPFQIPKSWPRFRAIDWGYSDPFCCLWFAVGPDNHIYVYRELYRTRLTDQEYAQAIVSMSRHPDGTPESISYTVGDPGSFGVEMPDTGKTRYETFAVNGVAIMPADNDRSEGWSSVREYLRLREYMNGKSPWVHISRDCPNLIRTLPALVHSERKPEEVADGLEDHAPDTLRYGLRSRAPIFNVKQTRPMTHLEAAERQMERNQRKGVDRWA